MSYLQGQWKYGKAKEAVVRQGWSIATRKEHEKVEKRKEKDQGRREGCSSEGKVPCDLNQEFLFFWFTSIGVQKRPVLVEVLAPTRLGLRGSHVQRQYRKRTPQQSKSSTIKGILYAQ
jgi:hypothetical protein